MSAVGIIIVKENSNRFPGKNYYHVDGVPMFYHNVKLLLGCDKIDDVYVCTDSNYSRSYCLGRDIKVIWRGKNISADEQPFFEVLKYAYQSIPERYDIIVTVLANSIDHNKDGIEKAIEIIEKNEEVKEVRSFDKVGNQSGILAFKDCLFYGNHTLAHMAMIRSDGKEIHYKGELDERTKLA